MIAPSPNHIDQARKALRAAIRVHSVAETNLATANANIGKTRNAATAKALSLAREEHLSASLALDASASQLASHLALAQASHVRGQFNANLSALAGLQLIERRSSAFGPNPALSQTCRALPLSLDEIDGLFPSAGVSARAHVERFICELRRDPNTTL
jgi:hypothetical protein